MVINAMAQTRECSPPLLSGQRAALSIGTHTALAETDSGADLNVMSTDFGDSLPVSCKNKFRKRHSKITCPIAPLDMY